MNRAAEAGSLAESAAVRGDCGVGFATADEPSLAINLWLDPGLSLIDQYQRNQRISLGIQRKNIWICGLYYKYISISYWCGCTNCESALQAVNVTSASI